MFGSQELMRRFRDSNSETLQLIAKLYGTLAAQRAWTRSAIEPLFTAVHMLMVGCAGDALKESEKLKRESLNSKQIPSESIEKEIAKWRLEIDMSRGQQDPHEAFTYFCQMADLDALFNVQYHEMRRCINPNCMRFKEAEAELCRDAGSVVMVSLGDEEVDTRDVLNFDENLIRSSLRSPLSKCDGCHSNSRKREVTRIEWSEFLFAQFNRARAHNLLARTSINLPPTLHLGAHTYRLCGIIIHIGESAESGHYIAYEPVFNGGYWIFNDDSVSFTQTAPDPTKIYMALYERRTVTGSATPSLSSPTSKPPPTKSSPNEPSGTAVSSAEGLKTVSSTKKPASNKATKVAKSLNSVNSFDPAKASLSGRSSASSKHVETKPPSAEVLGVVIPPLSGNAGKPPPTKPSPDEPSGAAILPAEGHKAVPGIKEASRTETLLLHGPSFASGKPIEIDLSGEASDCEIYDSAIALTGASKQALLSILWMHDFSGARGCEGVSFEAAGMRGSCWLCHCVIDLDEARYVCARHPQIKACCPCFSDLGSVTSDTSAHRVTFASVMNISQSHRWPSDGIISWFMEESLRELFEQRQLSEFDLWVSDVIQAQSRVAPKSVFADKDVMLMVHIYLYGSHFRALFLVKQPRGLSAFWYDPFHEDKMPDQHIRQRLQDNFNVSKVDLMYYGPRQTDAVNCGFIVAQAVLTVVDSWVCCDSRASAVWSKRFCDALSSLTLLPERGRLFTEGCIMQNAAFIEAASSIGARQM
ncbi:MAG TPA: hypothetical protein VEF04_15745, partial [Blastocatellia bacterium]|nr:hypothetical protein [Blastocatellia bacterium]